MRAMCRRLWNRRLVGTFDADSLGDVHKRAHCANVKMRLAQIDAFHAIVGVGQIWARGVLGGGGVKPPLGTKKPKFTLDKMELRQKKRFRHVVARKSFEQALDRMTFFGQNLPPLGQTRAHVWGG